MTSDISMAGCWLKQHWLSRSNVGQKRPAQCGLDQHGAMDDWKAIGARIREVRNAKDLTQVELAAAIGVSRAHLTNVEGGNGGLALDKLSLLATETGTTVAWLIGEAGPADESEVALLAAFRPLDQRDREAAVRIVQSLRSGDPPTTPARKVALKPKERAPPPPFVVGGNVQENRVSRTILRLVQEQRACPGGEVEGR